MMTMSSKSKCTKGKGGLWKQGEWTRCLNKPGGSLRWQRSSYSVGLHAFSRLCQRPWMGIYRLFCVRVSALPSMISVSLTLIDVTVLSGAGMIIHPQPICSPVLLSNIPIAAIAVSSCQLYIARLLNQVIMALVTASGPLGLSAFLPPKGTTVVSPPPEGPLPKYLPPPHLPLTSTWHEADFDLQSVLATTTLPDEQVDLRMYTMKLLSRYQYLSGRCSRGVTDHRQIETPLPHAQNARRS